MILFHCWQTKTQFNIKSITGNWQNIFSIISSGRCENSFTGGVESSESSPVSLSSPLTRPYMEDLADDIFLLFLGFFFPALREESLLSLLLEANFLSAAWGDSLLSLSLGLVFTCKDSIPSFLLDLRDNLLLLLLFEIDFETEVTLGFSRLSSSEDSLLSLLVGLAFAGKDWLSFFLLDFCDNLLLLLLLEVDFATEVTLGFSGLSSSEDSLLSLLLHVGVDFAGKDKLCFFLLDLRANSLLLLSLEDLFTNDDALGFVFLDLLCDNSLRLLPPGVDFKTDFFILASSEDLLLLEVDFAHGDTFGCLFLALCEDFSLSLHLEVDARDEDTLCFFLLALSELVSLSLEFPFSGSCLCCTTFTMQQSLSEEIPPFSSMSSLCDVLCFWRFCSFIFLPLGRFSGWFRRFLLRADFGDEEGAIGAIWEIEPRVSLEQYTESLPELSSVTCDCQPSLPRPDQRKEDVDVCLGSLPTSFTACLCTFVAVVKPLIATGNANWSEIASPVSLDSVGVGNRVLFLRSFFGFTRKFTSSLEIPLFGVK